MVAVSQSSVFDLHCFLPYLGDSHTVSSHLLPNSRGQEDQMPHGEELFCQMPVFLSAPHATQAEKCSSINFPGVLLVLAIRH